MSEVNTQKVKVALFGLGRLGTIRARILLHQQPHISLVAACDTKPGAEAWCTANMPPTVRFFDDPEECLEKCGADAVLVSTATATHGPIVMRALDLGFHVMCEKPISVDIATSQAIVDKAKTLPQQRFLVPFCRRYDDSCASAKTLVDSGALGDIHAVESDCLDKQDPTGFFVNFSEQSGGIFVDMGVHDIDIARWYLDVKSGIDNPKRQVHKVFALGQQAIYKDLKKFEDADNGWGLVEFANGRILNLHIGRTLTNGFESRTRIYGTKGTAVINGNSNMSRIEVRDVYGARTETTADAFVLYEKSFVNDLEEFAASIVENRPLRIDPLDALEASKIAIALQHSFRNGKPVYFDDEGMPILESTKANGDIKN